MKLLIENNRPVSFVSDTYSGFTVKALPSLKLEQYTTAILINLIDRDHGPKEAAKFRIKAKASEMLDALNWRMERAQERERLDEVGEPLSDVMREREAIRRASNRSEQEVEELEDVSEIRGYQFKVISEDWPPAKRFLSQYKFRQRFTLTEKAAIVTARQSDPMLDAILGDMDSSLYLDLDDPELAQGLDYVGQQGLIAEGRVSEILEI